MVHLQVIKIYTPNSPLHEFMKRAVFHLVIVLTQGHIPKIIVSLASMNSQHLTQTGPAGS